MGGALNSLKASHIDCPHSSVTRDRQALFTLGMERGVEEGRKEVERN